MSEPNMTFNQALQELNRVCNVWRAASMLQDALQVASNLEGEIKRLESHKDHLDSEIEQVEEMMRQRLDAISTQLTEAEAKNKEAMAACEAEAERISKEHDEQVEKKRDETLQEMDRLTLSLATKQAACTREAEAMDEQIKTKRSLIAELNQQLDALRERLG